MPDKVPAVSAIHANQALADRELTMAKARREQGLAEFFTALGSLVTQITPLVVAAIKKEI